MAILLDANAVLRYLLRDIPEQAHAVKELVDGYDAYVYPEILAEVVYVLAGVYEMPRQDIAKALLILLDEIPAYDREMLEMALRVFGDSSLDFVDCLLVARNSVLRENVLSFDKKLNQRLIEW